MICGAQLAISIIKNKCWEGSERIFRKMYWRVDLKRASRLFDCVKLDLLGHRWHKVMTILKISS
jgi:hypothetical protein